MLANLNLISVASEETAFMICDFTAKVLFSESLLLRSFKTLELRRYQAMRAIEDVGKQRLINDLKELVASKDR